MIAILDKRKLKDFYAPFNTTVQYLLGQAHIIVFEIRISFQNEHEDGRLWKIIWWTTLKMLKWLTWIVPQRESGIDKIIVLEKCYFLFQEFFWFLIRCLYSHRSPTKFGFTPKNFILEDKGFLTKMTTYSELKPETSR